MRSALETSLHIHMRVILETLVSVITLTLIAAGAYLFLSGSQIFESNTVRAGVRVNHTVSGSETQYYGSFVARSDCTHVDVLTDTTNGEPVVYLTESEHGACEAYRNPLPYTFTAAFDGRYTSPLAVYMNGDRIATIEE
jgi:hypothetical protein